MTLHFVWGHLSRIQTVVNNFDSGRIPTNGYKSDVFLPLEDQAMGHAAKLVIIINNR